MKRNSFISVFKRAGTIVWVSVSAFIVALLIVASILMNTLFEPILQTVLGGPKPIKGDDTLEIYKSEYNSKKDSVEAGNKLNVQIEEEGIIMLVNEKDALPISTASKKAKVSVFGHNSVDLVLGGSGSGGVSNVKATTIYDSLEKANFEYNPSLKRFYESSAAGSKRSSNPALSDSSSSAPTLDIGETPVKNYTSDVRASFKEYGDAAIVVISRLGGESWDLPRKQNVANGGIEGNHYLQLDQNEYDMLDMVTAKFDKVIVLLNTLTSFQCDFIEEYNNMPDDPRIDAVLWIGGPGVTGAEAIGSVLNGTVNPSGRTTDIYSRDFTKDPTWQNFGDGSQTSANGEENTSFLQNGSPVAGYSMITYEEGIYVGYRYYETRGFEEAKNGNALWYGNNVIFPFGYGLSYTSFKQTMQVSGSLDESGKVTVSVTVENIGSKAGKDVVELYVSKPYYEGGIEKSHVELIDFAKTDLLETSGSKKSQTINFTVSPYDLASYDYNDANGNGFKGYELEHGDYTFIISSNSHVDENAYDSATVTLAADRTFGKDPVTQYDVVNLYTSDGYDDIQYKLSDVKVNGVTRKGMSRTDFEGTFPTPLTVEDRTVSFDTKTGLDNVEFDELGKLQSREPNNPTVKDVAKPVTGADVVYKLRDLVDVTPGSANFGKADYDDAKWEKLLDSLTFDEMLSLVNDGAFKTVAIEKIGKNLTNDSDGPIGFVNFMAGISNWYSDNTTFCCEIVIGSTWNKDLAYQMGKIVGENGLYGAEKGNGLSYSGWYAPAVNLHRSPFSGRNFEYYSEDAVLSGKLAVYVVNGAASKGVYADLKHFALNDQETNRAGVSTFCTEQALRELYLKAFEICVKGNDSPEFSATAVKDGVKQFNGATGILSSFNRIGNTWTGGDYRLMTEILRNEWGFRGLVICDYKTDNFYMDSKQMLYAGNDLILTSLTSLMWENADANSAEDVYVLRQATKNILYTVANSNSVQIDIVGYRQEWWKSLMIALDVIVPVGLAVWGYFVIRKGLKNGFEVVSDDDETASE